MNSLPPAQLFPRVIGQQHLVVQVVVPSLQGERRQDPEQRAVEVLEPAVHELLASLHLAAAR